MMYPAETSLIPATVSLLRYITQEGLTSFSGMYPYWYLGTTPLKFLIGPIIPLLINFVYTLNPYVSLFNISIYMVFVSFLITAFGYIVFSNRLFAVKTNFKTTSFLIIIFLIFPWKYISGFALDDLTITVARSILPWVFVFGLNFLERSNKRNFLTLLFLCLLLLLISTSVLMQLLVGLTAVTLSFSLKSGKVKNFIFNLKKMSVVVLLSLVLVTFWYGIDYWLTIIFNPSIGGLSFSKVFLRLFDIFRLVLPIVFALFVVRLGKKIKDIHLVFVIFWLSFFGIVTFYKFISDIDFWQDYTFFLNEIEIGLFLFCIRADFLFLKKGVFVLLFSFLPSLFVYRSLGSPDLIVSKPPYYINSINEVLGVVDNNTLFVSGSSVFWINSFFDIKQVRGGRDQVAVNPYWDKAAYEIREGFDPELTKIWLNRLDIGYVLVHDVNSMEYYHDFKTISKWNKVGDIIWKSDGDYLIEYK